MLSSITRDYVNLSTGKRDRSLESVLGDVVHVDTGKTVQGSPQDHTTMFRDIEVVPIAKRVPHWSRELMGLDHPTRSVKLDDFLDEVLDAYRLGLEQEWKNNGRLKLVFHSSGYDSRLFSWLLMELRKKNGDDWLGDVRFVCLGHECDAFNEIIDYEGWEPELKIMVNPTYGPTSLPEGLFDFKTAWKQAAGVSSYPLNLWYDILSSPQLADLGDDVEIWTACYANEIFKQKMLMRGENNYWRRFLERYYFSVYCLRDTAVPGCMNHSVLNRWLVETVVNADIDYNYRPIRQDLAARADPKLAKIHRESVLPYNIEVPKQAMRQMINDYASSAYGKEIVTEITPPKEIRLGAWWELWSAASFVEHLINKGCEVHLNGRVLQSEEAA